MEEKRLWEVVATWTLTIYANLIFLVLWVGFIAALIMHRGWMDAVWNWAQALPTGLRAIVWIALLPIMVGLWIWESSWPTLGKLAGLAGIIAWTLVAVSNWPKAIRMKVKPS